MHMYMSCDPHPSPWSSSKNKRETRWCDIGKKVGAPQQKLLPVINLPFSGEGPLIASTLARQPPSVRSEMPLCCFFCELARGLQLLLRASAPRHTPVYQPQRRRLISILHRGCDQKAEVLGPPFRVRRSRGRRGRWMTGRGLGRREGRKKTEKKEKNRRTKERIGRENEKRVKRELKIQV